MASSVEVQVDADASKRSTADGSKKTTLAKIVSEAAPRQLFMSGELEKNHLGTWATDLPLHSRFFQTNGFHVYYYAAQEATRHNLKGSFDLRDVTDICRADGASEHSLQLSIRRKYGAFANREEPI